MPRILFDHNVPIGLRALLAERDITLAREMDWAQISNGALLLAAERAGFQVLITADQNLRYQQNLLDRALAIIVLRSNHWKTIRNNIARIDAAIHDAGAGSFVEIEFLR